MPQLATDQEKEKTMPPTAQDFAPRRYSPRASAKMSVKLMLVAGSILALLWMADTLISP